MRKQTRRRQAVFILSLTLIVILALGAIVGISISSVRRQVTRHCFTELRETCLKLADNLYKTADMDRTILTAMSALIADGENMSDTQLCDIMRSYQSSASYISYVELLRPDGSMLDADGNVRDVSSSFDFAGEARQGARISNIEWSTQDSQERVLRNAVPVIRDGETVYMLYGVVRLSDLAEKYTTDVYDGHAYVYLIDGHTGDFMLDTWHSSYGNIRDFSEREMLPGYSFDRAISNMADGAGGDLGFVSHTTGNVLYMHYEPVGVNSWNVAITVEEQYALKNSRAVTDTLYRMAALVAGVMLMYMFCVCLNLIQAYRQMRRLGAEDQTTGLQNRNVYDAFISEMHERALPTVNCIYIDVNGLHEVNNLSGHAAGDRLLQHVAEALKSEFPMRSIYRIGGDEFVVFCMDQSPDSCAVAMKRVTEQLSREGCSISYGIETAENETGLNRVTHAADEKMLARKKRYYADHDRRQTR